MIAYAMYAYINIWKFTIIMITKIIILILIMDKYLDNPDYCTALMQADMYMYICTYYYIKTHDGEL